MRLLIVSPSEVRGGAENYGLEIGRAACQRSWTVHVAIPHRPGVDSLVRDYRAAAATTHDIPVIGPIPGGRVAALLRFFAATVRVTRLIKSVRPDALQVILPWPTFALPALLAAALCAVPTVAVFQLVPDALSAGWRSVWRAPYYALMRRRNQRWVAVSSHGRDVLARAFRLPASGIDLIRNGIDLPDPSELATLGAGGRLRAELGLPARAVLALLVGRLDAQKGQTDAVEAVALAAADLPALHLAIAGEGPERECLTRRAERLGVGSRVHLLGQRAGMSELLGSADLFLFPSRFEGFPFALIEAMAHGLPAVATRFGGADEIIESGRDGLLVPIGDVPAFAAAITLLISEPGASAAMARAAQQKAAEFSREKMTTATLALLESVAGKYHLEPS